MASINENLKQLRLTNNFTQQEVAEKIGLTRQAISSYESGRTQPGIDMLMRFAKIYHVELEEILYGESNTNVERKRMKIVAVTVAVLCYLCHMIRVGLLTISQTFFALEEGVISKEMMGIAEMHFKLSNWATVAEKYSMSVLYIGALILLVFDLSGKYRISMKTKLLYIGAVFGGILLIGMIGTILCPILTIWDYLLPIIIKGNAVLLFFGMDVLGQYVKKRKKQFFE